MEGKVTLNENLHAFLFAQWIATNYADVKETSTGISVLNKSNGEWWVKQLKHFNEVVIPNYNAMGVLNDTEEYLKENLQS